MVRIICLGASALVLACAAPTTSDPEAVLARAALARPVIAPATWLALAADPHVVTLADDVALVCGDAVPAGDAIAPRCDAVRIGLDGARAPLGRDDLLAAARLDATRLVLLTSGGELRLHADGGGAQVLARDAADPRVASDRRRVIYTQFPPGGGAGRAPGQLIALDLDRGTRWIVADDPMDSSPFAVPGGDEVLFVSARTGLASLYLAAPGRAPRQVTNVGRRTVDADFVPVPGRELVWLDRPRVAIYTATYDGVATLWALALDTGAAVALGDGRRPRRAGSATIAVAGDRLIELPDDAVVARLGGGR